MPKVVHKNIFNNSNFLHICEKLGTYATFDSQEVIIEVENAINNSIVDSNLDLNKLETNYKKLYKSLFTNLFKSYFDTLEGLNKEYFEDYLDFSIVSNYINQYIITMFNETYIDEKKLSDIKINGKKIEFKDYPISITDTKEVLNDTFKLDFTLIDFERQSVAGLTYQEINQDKNNKLNDIKTLLKDINKSNSIIKLANIRNKYFDLIRLREARNRSPKGIFASIKNFFINISDSFKINNLKSEINSSFLPYFDNPLEALDVSFFDKNTEFSNEIYKKLTYSNQVKTLIRNLKEFNEVNKQIEIKEEINQNIIDKNNIDKSLEKRNDKIMVK